MWSCCPTIRARVRGQFASSGLDPPHRNGVDAPVADQRSLHAKTIHVREDAIVPDLNLWIRGLFGYNHLDHTAEALAAASGTAPDVDQNHDLEWRRKLADWNAKLTRYRALLEHDSDIAIAAAWIAETERERRSLERDLGRNSTASKFTKNEIKALVVQLRDIVTVLADSDPLDKRAIYEELGVNLTYHPAGGCVSPPGPAYLGLVSEGGLQPQVHSTLGRRGWSRCDPLKLLISPHQPRR